MQEVAYGSLVETRRRELHLQVGTTHEELYRDSPAEVYGLLGHHFAEADEPERAVEYLLKAGDAARAVYAQDEAIDLYRRALGFMERTSDAARARQLLLRIGLTHHLAFDFAAANAAFVEAFALPARAPERLEPTEWVRWPVEAAGAVGLLSALSYSLPTWLLGPNLFRGLLTTGRDLDIEPDVAQGFTVSDDGGSPFGPTRAGATEALSRRTTSPSPTPGSPREVSSGQRACSTACVHTPSTSAPSSSGFASHATIFCTASPFPRSQRGHGTSSSVTGQTGIVRIDGLSFAEAVIDRQ